MGCIRVLIKKSNGIHINTDISGYRYSIEEGTQILVYTRFHSVHYVGVDFTRNCKQYGHL